MARSRGGRKGWRGEGWSGKRKKWENAGEEKKNGRKMKAKGGRIYKRERWGGR